MLPTRLLVAAVVLASLVLLVAAAGTGPAPPLRQSARQASFAPVGPDVNDDVQIQLNVSMTFASSGATSLCSNCTDPTLSHFKQASCFTKSVSSTFTDPLSQPLTGLATRRAARMAAREHVMRAHNALPEQQTGSSADSLAVRDSRALSVAHGRAAHAMRRAARDGMLDASDDTQWIVISVAATVWGRYNCLNSSLVDTTLSFELTSSIINIGNGNGVLRGPRKPYACDTCTNCATSLSTFGSAPENGNNGGWSGFNYGALNTFTVLILSGGAVCVSQADLTLTYVPGPPVANNLSPRGGPAIGGTVVSIWGDYFRNSTYQQILCFFGDSTVKAVFVSPMQVTCTTPGGAGTGTATVSLRVSQNTQSFSVTGNNFVFTYYTAPLIEAVVPAIGSEGDNITLVGSGFFDSPLLGCSFGGFVVAATLLNSTAVSCLAPSGFGSAIITITENGQQFSNSSVMFTYATPQLQRSFVDYLLLVVFGATALVALVVAAFLMTYLRYRYSPHSHAYETVAEGNYHSSSGLLLDPSQEWSHVPNTEIRLGERVGRGTHGEVFRGVWHDTPVAVKKLAAQNITPEFEADLQREALLMRSLRHPNVLQFLATCTIGENVCIIMEFMSRGSLFDILHDSSVVWIWDTCQRIMMDAARGMAYLHGCRLLHRDLKSGNLLLDENYKCKVCDFGLSKINQLEDNATMTACGTPCWAAPELLRNQRYSEKADIYSYGVVLWECMSREVPYAGMPPFQVVYAVSTQGVRPPVPEDCPPEVQALMCECWAEDPSVRPAFTAIIARLEQIEAFGWSKTVKPGPHTRTPARQGAVSKRPSEVAMTPAAAAAAAAGKQ